ncbi:MAG TPA: hypothetical protein DGT23_31435 [Micromonosporaceae bacterium]|nr:hypothetical protein [Micromonosporaceae bacterium]
MMTRTLTASGLAVLLAATLATPATAVRAPQAACTVAEPSQSQLTDSSVAEHHRAVNEEVAAVFGTGKPKERIAEQLRRGLIGTVVDHGSGTVTVVATPGFPAARQLSSAKVITGCHTAGELIAAEEVLVSRSWHPEATKASFGFSLHAADSKYHVSFDSRYPEAAKALQKALGDKGLVTVAETGRAGRLDDGEPHFGGAGIRQNSGSMYSNTCTSGFTVRRNADGQRGAMTAGHCFYDGAYIYSGPQYYGYTFGRVNYPAYDIIGIRSGTETYDNVIHTDSCCPVKRDVVGRDPAQVGDLVCLSGMVTKALCSVQVTSVNGYFCDANGCTGGLIEGIRNNQVIVRGGDSGAPIYTRYGSNGALAMGMLIGAAGNGTIAYGEHIAVIESYLNVSVLTW